MANKSQGLSRQAIIKVLGFIIQRWREYPLKACGITFLMLMATITDVFTPAITGKMINTLSESTNEGWHQALWLLGTLLGLGIIGILLQTAAIRLVITMTLSIMQRLIQDAFARIQRFSGDWHANTFAGSTVRKITRGSWAVDSLDDILLVELLPCIVMLFGTSIMLAFHWLMMGLIVGALSIIYIVVVSSLSLFYMSPAASLANAQDTRMSGTLADAITCNAVVKAFGAERREDERLHGVVSKWQRRTLRWWSRMMVYGVSQQSMMWVIQLIIFGAGLWLWHRHEANVGDIAYVMSAFFVLQGYLRDIGMQIRGMQRAVNDMEELVDLMHQPFGVEDIPNARPIAITEGKIVFDHVDFRYPNREQNLYNNFSITIQPGERVGLVGHSGSGKSSFIKLIQRIHDIEGGTIFIDGQDISRVQQSSLRSQIAIVQQEPILFHRTLTENIAYARPSASQEEIEEAARLANADEFIRAQPQGYATLVGERGVKLSGGERQRIAIARAFLANSPILILDEATSSLDSESERQIQEAIERLMVGRTTLVVAHRLSTVRSLDRLLVMDHGEVREEGPHEALISIEGGIYRRLYERQALDLIDNAGQA
ncbi:putative multidrug export ATP-binding/permease protein [Halomonadaceae bacterium LMG 33818]|uniref:ABC transporter ATP-binding protein n=1 Tax=Cernens ardua TaxID=3402176 RepID=UPI003EDC9A28